MSCSFQKWRRRQCALLELVWFLCDHIPTTYQTEKMPPNTARCMDRLRARARKIFLALLGHNDASTFGECKTRQYDRVKKAIIAVLDNAYPHHEIVTVELLNAILVMCEDTREELVGAGRKRSTLDDWGYICSGLYTLYGHIQVGDNREAEDAGIALALSIEKAIASGCVFVAATKGTNKLKRGPVSEVYPVRINRNSNKEDLYRGNYVPAVSMPEMRGEVGAYCIQ